MNEINKIPNGSFCDSKPIDKIFFNIEKENYWFRKIYIYKYLVLIILLIVFTGRNAHSQINFGSFGQYTIQLNNISVGNLEFEWPIIPNGGEYEVSLENSFIIGIEGVKYLDVGVLIIAEGELLLEGLQENSGDPSKSIPFTLEAAYANKGQENISDVVYITIISNMGDARFPILSRQLLPPGPPPPPPTEGFNQMLVEESAYLYLYGKINVGNIDAGYYIGNITVSVEYDNPPDNPLDN